MPLYRKPGRAAHAAALTALLLLVFSGCATTTAIRPGEPFHLPGKATVATKDGRTIATSSVLRVGDCLHLASGTSEYGVILPLHAVENVTVVSRSEGFWQGLYLGPLIGVSTGLLLGWTLGGECEQPNAGACFFEGPGGMAYLLGLGGLIYGPVLGALKGKSRVYVFPSADPGSGCP